MRVHALWAVAVGLGMLLLVGFLEIAQDLFVGKYLRSAFPDGPRRPTGPDGRGKFLVIFGDADRLIGESASNIKGEARPI